MPSLLLRMGFYRAFTSCGRCGCGLLSRDGEMMSGGEMICGDRVWCVDDVPLVSPLVVGLVEDGVFPMVAWFQWDVRRGM